MMYENNFYRTRDGTLDLEFLFVDTGPINGWRAYIISDIDYKCYSNDRSVAISDIHRLTEKDEARLQKIHRFIQSTRDNYPDTKPVHYICWTEKIDSLDKMRNIARAWSEITAYYIRYGGRFDKIQALLEANGFI